MTIFDACLEATDDIWDERELYILAVLKVLNVDPHGDIEDFHRDYQP